MNKIELFASDRLLPPQIFSAGYNSDPETARYGPSVRDRYFIHFVLSGKGYFNHAPVGKGEGFLITPGMPEEYHPDPNDPWTFLWFTSEDPRMAAYFDLICADPHTNVFSFHSMYALTELRDTLCAAPKMLSSSRLLSEFFLHIFNGCVASERTAERHLTKVYFDFSVNYIKTNLHLPVTVEMLCQTLGVSQPYLYKTFKREVGISPLAYIHRLRLETAKAMLLNTTLSVSQVAESVGFRSVLDFSKFFSKRIGCSPTAFRRSV